MLFHVFRCGRHMVYNRMQLVVFFVTDTIFSLRVIFLFIKHPSRSMQLFLYVHSTIDNARQIHRSHSMQSVPPTTERIRPSRHPTQAHLVHPSRHRSAFVYRQGWAGGTPTRTVRPSFRSVCSAVGGVACVRACVTTDGRTDGPTTDRT